MKLLSLYLMSVFLFGNLRYAEANNCTEKDIYFAHGNANGYLVLYDVLRNDLKNGTRSFDQIKYIFETTQNDPKEIVKRCAPEQFEIVQRAERLLGNEIRRILEK